MIAILHTLLWRRRNEVWSSYRIVSYPASAKSKSLESNSSRVCSLLSSARQKASKEADNSSISALSCTNSRVSKRKWQSPAAVSRQLADYTASVRYWEIFNQPIYQSVLIYQKQGLESLLKLH